MLIKYLAYIPSIIGTLIVITFIALNNYRSKLNRLFLLLTGLATLWIASLFVADTANNAAVGLQAVRLGISISTLIGPVFLFFSRNFPEERKASSVKRTALVLLPAILLSVISLTPYMIRSIAITKDGAQLSNSTSLYSLDTIVLVAYFVVGAYGLVAKRHRSEQVQKRQIDLVLLAIFIVFITNLITNYILTLFNIHGGANLVGAFSIFIFSVVVAYAMVKHQLFDIRLLVVRSFAYLLSLATVGLIFTFIAFAVAALFFQNNDLDATSARWLYTILAIILALIFPWLRKFFNRISNQIFYRDAYDTQAFLDEFNKALVTTYELNQLLKQSAHIIEQTIRPTYCTFYISKTETARARLFGVDNNQVLNLEDADKIAHAANDIKQKLIITDGLESSHETLRKLLREQDVMLMARLSASSSGNRANVGYLMLGLKKSGNPYSSQDVKVIEIIANELVIAIQNALRFEEIENFNITLQERVDDATKKLRHANERLKALDETKDDFISMASHQLRTPLTSVKGYLSMVLEGDAGKVSKQEREMLGQAFFSSQRMVYLIADLLNVSRLKTGKFVIEPTKVNLATVVEQEIGQLKETAQSRQLTLVYDEPKDFPEVMLDETKTRQVIMNFVDNAIYYTPAGGHITVRLIDSPATIALRVEDDGIGVPKSEQPHLFTKFYRAGNARKARPDGTGLGLFMAKKVIVAQGGSVIFESQEGKGSTFGFAFSKSHLRDLHATPSTSASQQQQPVVAKEKQPAGVK